MREIFLSILICSLGKLMAYPDFVYSDGNGNSFIVTQTALSYEPVSAKMSSSGFYSGGEPYQVVLKPNAKRKLESAFQACLKAPKSELDTERQKGTGFLSYQEQNTKKSLIFKMNSKTKEKLETTLKEIR